MQITLSNALVLTVRPVSQVAIDVLIGEQGGYAEMARLAAMSSAELSAYFKTLSYDEIKRRDAAQLKEMRYIFGWGVVDTPPPVVKASSSPTGAGNSISSSSSIVGTKVGLPSRKKTGGSAYSFVKPAILKVSK